MTLNEMAYRRGSFDAWEKFAATIPGMGGGAGGAVVPPISTNIPGLGSAAAKPGAPNQGLGTTPSLVTGVPGTPTVASLGKTQAQGAAVSAPPAAAPVAPSVSKSASVYAPANPPKASKIPRDTSPIGSNRTVETVKSAPAAAPVTAANVATPASTSSAGSSSPGGNKPLGGIVSSTGVSPAATVAGETASHTRGQVVSASGGGK